MAGKPEKVKFIRPKLKNHNKYLEHFWPGACEL